jgi:hypothetical protein
VVDLNVFEHFTPTLPASYLETPGVLLANIGRICKNHAPPPPCSIKWSDPRFVVADTMESRDQHPRMPS